MKDKINLIIDLLNEGKTYTQIQSELGVSPSRISEVKKKFLGKSINSDDDETGSELIEIKDATDRNSIESSNRNNLKINNMDKNSGNSANPDVLLKIKKMEQDHEVVMKELELAKLEMEHKLDEANSVPDYVISELQSQISELENRNADLETDIENLNNQVMDLEEGMEENNQLNEEENEDNRIKDDSYFDDEGNLNDLYFEDLTNFLDKILENEGAKLGKDEIKELEETSTYFLDNFKIWLENIEEDPDEYVEPDLLALVGEEMNSFAVRLANKGKEKIKFRLSEELLVLLGEFFEEE